ncbi:MAG: rhamnulokinase, partial [Clostridia bacterium]|nr:rhamnulokinase [Clostridia bacterium]
MNYYLAIDIGASSGRHILGWLDNGKLKLKEVHRFENHLVKTEQGLVWDLQNLVAQVKVGMKKCGELGKQPVSVAIDTWGVDYVLTDADHEPLLPIFSYRDGRTQDVVPEVEKRISPEQLYRITGIQKQNFNTIYQLYADKISGKLDKAKSFMMMPAYLSFCLCGTIQNEYTNATTTGLVRAETYEYDEEILHRLGLRQDLFQPLMNPGQVLGELTEKVQQEIGYNCKVLFCPSHDTASAVAACPLEENDIFISSGTWSLIGCELLKPILSMEARTCNFTNEGGIGHRFRFLKNYMGMWLF